MATTHEHSQSHTSEDASVPEEKDRTLLIQGGILAGIVVLLLIASFFDVI